MSLSRRLASILPICLLTAAAQQQPQPRTIADPDIGFSFTVPASYQAQKQPFGYLLARQGVQGMILVIPIAETAMPKLRELTEEGFLAGEAMQLRPTAAVRTLTPRSLGAEMSGTIQGMAVRAYSVTLAGGAQRSAYLLGAAPVAQFSQTYVDLVHAVAQSVKFGVAPAATAAPPSTTGPSAKDPAAAAWDQRLRGRKLHYFSRYNSNSGGSYAGYSEHKTIGLCEDGTFLVNGEFSGAIDVPGASASVNGPSSNAGRWSIVSRNGAVYLQLGNESAALTTDGSKTFLNGTRWMVDDREKGCR